MGVSPRSGSQTYGRRLGTRDVSCRISSHLQISFVTALSTEWNHRGAIHAASCYSAPLESDESSDAEVSKGKDLKRRADESNSRQLTQHGASWTGQTHRSILRHRSVVRLQHDAEMTNRRRRRNRSPQMFGAPASRWRHRLLVAHLF